VWAALLGALVAPLLAACSTADVPLLTSSASDLAGNAVSLLRSHPVMEVKGRFTDARSNYQVSLLERPSTGAAQGSGFYDDAPFQYRQAKGVAYIQGSQFWQSVYTSADKRLRAKGYGQGWVRTDDITVDQPLLALNEVDRLAAGLTQHRSRLRRGGTIAVGGGEAVALVDGATTYYVTQTGPTQLVGIASSGQGRVPGAGTTQTRIVISYPRVPLQVDAPQHYVDPARPATLPALYQVEGVQNQSFGSPSCDQNSCTFNITVLNQTGPPAQPASVTLQILKSQDSSPQNLIGSCAATIPATIGTGQQGVTSCQVSGTGWSSWVNSGANSYYYQTPLHNPPYTT
jgi:hypothetical protein